MLRYRTQAKILQTILKSKSEDADQHTSIRDELKSSLAEVLNTRKAREHELVECNKDLTRLKMSSAIVGIKQVSKVVTETFSRSLF